MHRFVFSHSRAAGSLLAAVLFASVSIQSVNAQQSPHPTGQPQLNAAAPKATVPQASAPHAPDRSLGMALMFAEVNSEGALLRGAGATGSSKLGTGAYEVLFERDITACGYNATSYFIAYSMAIQPRGDAPNGLYVSSAATSNGLVKDTRFVVTVMCVK